MDFALNRKRGRGRFLCALCLFAGFRRLRCFRSFGQLRKFRCFHCLGGPLSHSLRFDGLLHQTQDHLRAFLNGGSQYGCGSFAVEIVHILKVLFLEKAFHLLAAPGQYGEGDTDRRRTAKLDADIQFVQFFQKTALDGIDDSMLIVVPIGIGKLERNADQLLGKTLLARDAKDFFQAGGDCLLVCFVIFPEIHRGGVPGSPGICHVENIAQSGFVVSPPQQGNPFCSSPDIAVQALVPNIVLRTGCCTWALNVDHELVVEPVLIHPTRRFQKCDPILDTARDVYHGTVRHFGILLDFCRHGNPPPCRLIYVGSDISFISTLCIRSGCQQSVGMRITCL